MEPQDLNFDIPASGAVFAFGKKVPGRFHIKNDSIISAACGEEHALVATSSGRLFAFGKNDSGQLGLGHREPGVAKPTCVKRLRELGEKAVRVACGPTHSLVTTESGKVFGWGINTDGQVTGQATDYAEPVEIPHLGGKEVKDLVAGRSFSLVLTKQGEIFGWGSNDEGCLGCGNEVEESRDSLVQVQLPDRAVSLSAGTYHCACVLANGQVYTWGESEGGKLGYADSESQATQYLPHPAPLPPLASDETGTSSAPAPPKARAVACGLKHTLALCEAGRVFACGSGESGQLGLGAGCGYTPAFMQLTALGSLAMACISAGESHSACVSAEAGLLYTFGDALHGKLGPSSRLGGHSNQHRPFKVRALKPIRCRRAICGNVMTLVLAAQRAPGDPALTAADSDEADDPLDSMSARSPRPLRLTEQAAVEATGGVASSDSGGQQPLLRRRSSRSRQKYRELARSSGTMSMPPSMLNGSMTFELVRPAMQGAPRIEDSAKSSQIESTSESKDANGEAISKFDELLAPLDSDGVEDGSVQKQDAALAAFEPEVKPQLLRRPSESKPSGGPTAVPEDEDEDDSETPQQVEDREETPRQPTADEQPVSAPVLIEEMASEQRQTPGEQPAAGAAEAAAPTDDAGGTQQPVKSGGCGRRKRPGEPAGAAAAGAAASEGAGASGDSVKAAGCGRSRRKAAPEQQQQQQDDETVVAASAGTAESAPPSQPETAEAEASGGTSGAVKSGGCGGRSARRQKAPATATEGDVEEAVTPADAKTAESAPPSEEAPKDESASGAVKGVGCGGRSRRQGQQQQAEPAVEEAVVASDAKAAESAPGGPEGGDSGAVKGVGCGGRSRRQGQQQQAEPAVEEAVVASDAKAAESAPGGPEGGDSGAVKGVGCGGRSRRQKQQQQQQAEPAVEEAVVASDAQAAESAPAPAGAEDVADSPNTATGEGDGGAVKGVGCGGRSRRRQQQQQPEASADDAAPATVASSSGEDPAAGEPPADSKSSKSCAVL
ncbi:hypothetical protein BOX15_Mlig031159g2 [Macrostomum lignano]|uniref:RCC1-like domain-containing protein n=2 Tax=Macrostomum lignano TaxID=282301 RepID=A0A267E017_9PLAT|nr:hypothetical protein BOX15_Mlig031159g2 [Macrostomum lignano]